MLNKILSIAAPVLTAVLVAIFIVVMATQLSCMSAPDREDYTGRPNACYDFADCLYRNKDNPDKSICGDIGKECRSIERYEYCRDDSHRPANMDFEKCWLYLNQK